MTWTDTQTQRDFFVDEKMQLKAKSKNTSGMTIYELIIKFIEAKKKSWFFLKWIQFSTKKEGVFLLKVNNRNTRTRCKICSKLTIKAPEGCH